MTEPKLASKGLRIVQLTAVGISAKSFLTEHFRRLRQAGNEVLLVCSDDRDARDAAETGGIQFVPIAIKRNLAPFSDLVSVFRLRRLFRSYGPDVVHAHMSKAGLLGMLAARLAGVPTRIYHNHGLALISARGIKRRLLKITERLTNRWATHVLFCSDSTRNAAIDAGVASAERSVVLGQGTISGVDVERFHPDRATRLRAQQRKTWGIPNNRVVVGYVGRLLVEKGIEELIEAWRRLDPDVRQKACLLLVGCDALGEPGMQSLVKKALSESIGIKAMPWTNDMVACYSGMDMLVLPSWREGFPYCILEAQSMNLPVVTTRATGCVDAIVDESTGLAIGVKDPVALANALSRLICSPDERRQFGDRGRQRVLETFTQERVLQDLLDFYSRQVGIGATT